MSSHHVETRGDDAAVRAGLDTERRRGSALPVGTLSPATLAALGFLVFSGIVVGAWATVNPSEFYRAFPGFGHAWISADGPYNEHLIRDTGAAYLLVAALAALGLLRPALASPFAIGFATLFFNVPHVVYHGSHLAVYGPLDRVLNVVALGTAVLCSVWLITPWAQPVAECEGRAST